jgi:hypothetical protein
LSTIRSPFANPEPENVNEVAPAEAPDHVPDPGEFEIPHVIVVFPDANTILVEFAPDPRRVTPLTE